MPVETAPIDLTSAERRQLTPWARAGATPQRRARRARLILGTAAGRGSRALACQERVSRTTVLRWRARFLARRCTGLRDRPRGGRPPTGRPATRALVVALARERPAARGAPLSRDSVADLTARVADRAVDTAPRRSTVWRLLDRDALRPWRSHPWLFPRDPLFLAKASPVLDLDAGWWDGAPLGPDEFVLSADEKTSIQARARCQPTLPPGPHQAIRVEHEYDRQGALQYLAAWDVHRAAVFGRCEPTTGKAAFGRLVEQVMAQEPYRSARRVFWIVDNGSSHRGAKAAQELIARHPTVVVVHLPTHASWLNQIELYFSILQRKVLTPNDFRTLAEVERRLRAFAARYTALAKPFHWRFTRQDLERRLRDPQLDAHADLKAA